MTDLVKEFCDSIHGKLSTLESRMEVLKSNVGSTWNSLQEKLEEVRERSELHRTAIAQARTALEQWDRQIQSEDPSNGEWQHREVSEVAARARQAEDGARLAIQIAESSFDEVERMVLEAIAARLEAEALIAS